MKTTTVETEILKHMDEAEEKAIDALSRYKFQMFGYWAAIWVHLNRISGLKRPSPFKRFVSVAREVGEDTAFNKAFPLTPAKQEDPKL